MKKNFLKKLAFTMAFATAFTALSPAAGVFAAKAPSLTVGKTLTLLLGTDRASHDINVNNKVKGSTYKWTTSNKAVATVNAKSGVVKGVKSGTAKVTLKITLPTKKAKTLSTTVNVKDNIKEVKINNAPETAINVGAEYDFNRTIVSTFGGNTKAHKGAVTRWEVLDADKKETKSASADDSGVFVATEPGKYLVSAVSFQSKAKYNEWLKSGDAKLETARSEAAEVTVKSSLASATLKKINQVELAFTGTVKDVVKSAADVRIESVATNKTIVPVKGVSVSEDGKTVLVDTYADFAHDVTYKVTAAESSVEFKAQVGTITSIVIENQQVIPITNVNDAKTLQYTVRDEYGVDVTDKYPLNNGLMQIITSSTSSSYVNTADGKLMIFAKGDVVSVQLKWLRYDTTTGADTSIVSNVATVTGVDSVASLTSNWTINTKNDFDKVVHNVAAGDNTKTLYVKVKDNYGVEKVNPTGINFTSLDESVLLVDKTTGKLYPLKVGTAVVKVENGSYVDYLTITVIGAIKSDKLIPDVQSARLSNSAALADSKTIKFTLKDNYDATFKFTGVGTIKALSQSNANAITVSGSALALNVERNITVVDGEVSVNFAAVAGQTGTSAYLVTVDGKTTVVTITVVAPAGASTYKVEVISGELDSHKSETSLVELYSADANGVKIARLTSVTGTAITYTVKDSAGNTKVNNALFNANSEVLSVDANGVPYANGTYNIYVNIGPVVATGTYTVKSSKPATSVKVERVSTTEKSSILAAINNTLTVKVGDTVVPVTNADITILNEKAVTGTGIDATINLTIETVLPIYIKTVTVSKDGRNYVVDVNQVITINK